VQSSRALGIFALSAVILAAISFGAVDVTIAGAGEGGPVPAVALVYAAIGTLALLASVVPAFTWFVNAIHHPHHDADIEPLPVPVRGLAGFEDDEL
jgi:hypothetical protein